jgi:methylglutaconyl-CoA hydratase
MESIGSASVPERVEMFVSLDSCPKPTVAAVQGACLGAGLALACCCDAVIASSDAFFAIPEVQLGIPPLAFMPLFVKAMGFSEFRRYALSGERFAAADAKALGIVHKVVSQQDLLSRSAEMADRFLRASPQACRVLKQAWAPFGGRDDLHSTMVRLAAEEQAVVKSDEAQAGLLAAKRKQRPPWYKPNG